MAKKIETKIVEKEESKNSLQVYEIDLGGRTIEVDGIYFKGKVKTVDKELSDKLNEILAKPIVYEVDLGNTRLKINGVVYHSIVKTEDPILKMELLYRKSCHDEGEKRKNSARKKDKICRDINDGKPVYTLRGNN